MPPGPSSPNSAPPPLPGRPNNPGMSHSDRQMDWMINAPANTSFEEWTRQQSAVQPNALTAPKNTPERKGLRKRIAIGAVALTGILAGGLAGLKLQSGGESHAATEKTETTAPSTTELSAPSTTESIGTITTETVTPSTEIPVIVTYPPVIMSNTATHEFTPGDPVAVDASETPAVFPADNTGSFPAKTEFSTDPYAVETECLSVPVDMPGTVSQEVIAEGAKTEFALSTQDILSYKEQLSNAQTKAEMQNILTTALYVAQGPAVRFDQPNKITNGEYTDVPLDTYRRSLEGILNGIAVIPKQLFQEFNGTDILYVQQDLPASTVHGENAAGEFNPGFDGTGAEVVVRTDLGDYASDVTTHEFMHDFFSKVCGKFDFDITMSNLYGNILENAKQYPELMQAISTGTPVAGTEALVTEQLAEVGLPSVYAGTNQAEFAAELLATLFSHDYAGMTPGQVSELHAQPNYRLAVEHAIDELAAILPGVNVPAMVGYLDTYYGDLSPAHISPDQVLLLNPAPDSLPFGADINSLVPAIQLQSGERIYASSGELSTSIRIPAALATDQEVTDSARAWMTSATGANILSETNMSDGSLVIIVNK